MDPEKTEFLFGGVPEDIDVDDPDQRELILAPADEEDPNRRLEGILRAIISNQVADDEPPETWSTARRLLALGLSRETVMNEIAMVLSTQVAAATGPEKRPFDPEEYRRGLAELPLPRAEEMREAFVSLAREHHPIDADDLDNRVAESFGRQPDDPIMRRLLDTVSDQLVEEQVLEYLAEDRMVHLADLTAGITLTHRLTGEEIENQVIVGTVDLAPFGHHRELRLKSGEPVEVFGDRWLPPEGFLGKLGEGRVLAVTVAEDGLADILPLAEPPPEDPVLVARFRAAYDRVVEEPDVPALVKEIVYELLADDRQLFGAPGMPLEDLCREAGLEVREDMAAHDERLWENQRQIRLWSRAWNAFGVKESYDAALRVLELAGQAHPGPAGLKQAVGDLADERVAEFVARELIDPDETAEDEVASAQEFASALIRAAGEGMPKVVAHWFAALLAERAREPVVAEAHLQVALSAGRDWGPVLGRAAWYASDRGDAAAALGLLRRMAEPHRQALELLSEFERSPQPYLGRNQPCWCGSGRKFKHCHLKQPEGFPLPERVGWLCFKAVWYLENQAGEALEEVSELARLRAADPQDQQSVLESMEDPLIMDLVLTEGGWFEDFLEARGTLLPEDEALLARSWTLVDRTVYEVEEVRPDSGVTVRDLATGELVEVRERTFSRQAQPGWLICARAVPDGESNQFVGGIFSVRPGTEGQLLDLCAEGDQYELAAWAGALHRPPRVTTREGEQMISCVAEWQVADSTAARRTLDGRYRREGDAWVESHELGAGEGVVRAQLRLEGDRLTVMTLSEERMDRVLEFLESSIPGRLLSDEREPFGPGLDLPEDMEDAGLPNDPDPEALLEAMAAFQEQMEDRWMSEPVPALAGLTPREAAADPTRREQLERLLASFEEMGPVPEGAFTFRVERLRRELGVDR